MAGYLGKSIGVRNLTWFPLKSDSSSKTDYEKGIPLSRVIDITVTPKSSEAILESDDSIEDQVTLTTGYDISATGSQVSFEMRSKVFGGEYNNAEGSLTSYTTDMPGVGALAFRSLLSEQNRKKGDKPAYAYYVFYKVRFADIEEKFTTLKSGGIEFQTHGLKGTAVSRESDDALRYIMRADEPNFDQVKADKWFDQVQNKAEQNPVNPVNP